MPEKNYYELLRVSRQSNQDELDEHYHQMLYQVHPDHNPGDEEKSNERFIALVKAYKTLSDPVQRKRYDFRMANPLIEEGETKGIKLLKSKDKKEAEARFIDGVKLARRNEWVKAAEVFRAALKLEADFAEASYNLALVGAILENGNFSLEVLARGLKANPANEALLRLRKGVSALFLSV